LGKTTEGGKEGGREGEREGERERARSGSCAVEEQSTRARTFATRLSGTGHDAMVAWASGGGRGPRLCGKAAADVVPWVQRVGSMALWVLQKRRHGCAGELGAALYSHKKNKK
jgi:hypothetical protein